MTDPPSLLTAMITPAVLISASGMLVLSTSGRLARVVDRVRHLTRELQEMASGAVPDFAEERLAEVERQISTLALRGLYIQRALTSLYVALSLFVAATIAIALAAVAPRLGGLPTALGLLGTLTLFLACMMLIGETRLALASVNREMAFALRLKELYRSRLGASSPP